MGTKKLISIMLVLLMFSSVSQIGIANQKTNLQYNDSIKEKLDIIQDAINDKQADWIAGYNNIFTDKIDFVDEYLGCNLNESEIVNQNEPISNAALPISYDWRDVDGLNYVTPIKNQASCGSCVGFATISALEAVVQIEIGEIFDCDLSESHLFFCGGGSCGGGWFPEDAADFVENVGVVDELCFPYSSYDLNCDQKQSNWKSRVIKAKNTGYTSENQNIKDALITYGPLLTTFEVFDDFSSYNGGIYEHVWGKKVGGHSVAIVGYNDDPGYWICKNSWGEGWGEEGFFNIKYRECNIDKKVYYFDQITGNIQPSKPEIIQPTHGKNSLDTTITLQWDQSYDIDGNFITYSIYLNEGYKIDFDSEPIISELATNSYEITKLKKDTIYSWQVISEDAEGSQHSDGRNLFFTRSPYAPTILGPTRIKKDKSYTYIASTDDTDGLEYYWFFQWGDDENSGWLGPYSSGEKVSVSHTWREDGDYTIKVRYKEDGIESNLGSLKVSNSKTRTYFINFIYEFLNHNFLKYFIPQQLFL